MAESPKTPFTILNGVSNKLFKRAVMFRKMIKRIYKGKVAASFNKSLLIVLVNWPHVQEAGHPFLKTVKIFHSATDTTDAKMILDSGCEIHNLISYQVVDDMHKTDSINYAAESICACLNGETLISMGTITLRWKGRGFRKIFETTFYVVGEDDVPWQVILGAETIRKESILKFTGFGGRTMLPRKSKGM
jgi:hypothetical protein